ncbi:MAG: TlpA family protein disulfide reductase [Holosporaceae bacterium]|jgi:thiol-disulfide isomerase/thioredoxin|nr:TlpA family protein disulfide reductase [Holosporaceae bacterium]
MCSTKLKVHNTFQYTKCLALVAMLLFSGTTGLCDSASSAKGIATCDFNFEMRAEGEENGFCLADLNGSVTVIVFFTTWCPNCPHVLQELDRLAAENLDGLKIIPLNIGNEDAAEVKKHYDEHRITNLKAYTSIASEKVSNCIHYIPSCFVFNKNGELVREYSRDGQTFNPENLKMLVRDLLN